ncbi:hypothetical protein AAF712_007985 [Marasmius tenuissimus]|uniref:RING-type domain-containing protein n=1 Tax=Marasmius tenuissimus TaxID=585030 RepID=A0ABR2ZV97_9AGAR
MVRTPSKKVASAYPSPPASPYQLRTSTRAKRDAHGRLPLVPTVTPIKQTILKKQNVTKAALQEELTRLKAELEKSARTQERQDKLVEQMVQEAEDKEEELRLHRQLQPIVETAIEYAEKAKDLIAHREYIARQKAILTCSGCSTLFSNPQELDCGHVYCAKCLDDWCYKNSSQKKNPQYKGEPLTCPKDDCRKDVVFGPIAAKRLTLEAARFSQATGIPVGESWPCFWPMQRVCLISDYKKKLGI